MEQEEIWRDIEGYEGQYEVSNLGKVRSLKYGKEKILNTGTNNKGYLQVVLYKEGKGKRFLIHRLVAYAFIPNPEGLPIINHRDENPKNNLAENLEWCDQRYNVNYGTGIERMVQTKIRNGNADPELCGIGDRKERDCLYYQKKRDQINEYQRERYQKNLDKMREYRQKNRSKIRINDRKKYYNMKERAREYYQEWLKNNQDQLSDDHTKGLW